MTPQSHTWNTMRIVNSREIILIFNFEIMSSTGVAPTRSFLHCFQTYANLRLYETLILRVASKVKLLLQWMLIKMQMRRLLRCLVKNWLVAVLVLMNLSPYNGKRFIMTVKYVQVFPNFLCRWKIQ